MVKQEPTGLVLTPAWNGLKQQVLHLAQFGGSIQVIQGLSGSGKTAFFSLIQEEELGTSLVSITVSPEVSSEDFFYTLVNALGLKPDPEASLGQLISSLRAFVQSQHHERSRIVVAVDDVHLLNEPSLAALISVLQGSTDSGLGLHLLFFSEPGIVELIDSLNLLDVTVHDAQLPAFSPSEVKQLLLEHFAIDQNASSISAEQVQSIWAESKGLPGQAIGLAQSLSESVQRASSFTFRGLPIVHFVALVLLCSVLFFVFVWRGGLNSEGVVETVESLEVVGSEVIAHEAKRNGAEAKVVTLDVQGPVVHQPSSSMRAMPAVKEKADAKDAVIKTVTVVKRAVAINPPGMPTAPAKAEDPSLPVAPKVLDVLKRNRWGGKVGSQDVLLGEAVFQKHKNTLLRYSETGFVLQVMAAGDLNKLQTYIRKQPNRANFLVYKAVRNGKLVCILLEGFYADKQSSIMAIANLPTNQRKGKPWPKALRSIQRELNSK